MNTADEQLSADRSPLSAHSNHRPVLLSEVLEYLKPRTGKNYIDATADGGGHAIAIIKAIQPTGKLLAIEWDEELYQFLEKRLQRECSSFSKNYVLHQGSYVGLEAITKSLMFAPATGILFDLGWSSFQTEVSKRGFSFRNDQPLDMRYSRTSRERASDIANGRTPQELESIIRNFGEERFARKISEAIVTLRKKKPIRTTTDLVEIIRRATPIRYHHSRIHFATRTFQAFRIAVNHEFENIEQGLAQATRVLEPGGRIVVISFHSLEDRIVKQFFRSDPIRSTFTPLTKKPITAGRPEIEYNPRSRSARLRAFEKHLLP